ncbi:hypothetical protein K4749_01070 [Streptomyces sp. TRM72054]|uniref:hypothetical protein n=1 Tax=Streptomyces sp. TRM72054 TaxID=2870562 RepID=UPI001C8BCF24|nr:hypothetical protein [Streptomyces sp. TRM72054]MBX9392221.1 hypothetical protein [Streptomyces sp. TRM72054]
MRLPIISRTRHERDLAAAVAAVKSAARKDKEALQDRLVKAENDARTAEVRAEFQARPVDAAPARPSDEVLRLRNELARSRKAQAALDADRAELIRINDQMNRQLREHTEAAVVEGSAS